MAAVSTIETLERVLNPKSKLQWRRDAASVWSLCDRDPLRLSEWCLRRLEMGLYEQSSEEAYLRHVMGSCHAVVDAEVKPFVKATTRSDAQIRQLYLEGEKQRVASWEQRRKALAERDEQQRKAASNEALKQRVAAAPKPPVIALHRQRLERSLKSTSAPEPMTIAPAPETKSHSRHARGECGVRLGKKIDELVAEIQHEAACESSCCAAPVAVLEKPPEAVDDVVDPPEVVITGGGDEDRAPVDNAAGGSGFTNQATVWDVMSGQGSLLTDLRDFLGRLDEDPRLRASANLRTMSRVREHLERVPESAAMGDPVELRLQDVLVLMNQLMARMR